jgi:dolichol kinase
MMSAEQLEDRELILAAHRLLSDIDASRFKAEAAAGIRRRLEEVTQRMANRWRLAPLWAALNSEVSQLPPGGAEKGAWLAFKKRVQPAYAKAAAMLREESVHVPSLRPTNYVRSVFHLASALVALLIIELSPSPWLVLGLAVAFSAFAWSSEWARRRSPAVNARLMRLFGPVAHQHEHHRVNSATWFSTAMVALAATGSSVLAAVAVVVLGVGDPVAALVGRRFGRHQLVHGRSLEGTLAFAISAGLSAFLVLRLLHAGELSAGAALAVAGCGALAGGVAELVSLRLDDNLSVPLSAALGAGVALFFV